jgi:hypothetical protein
VWNDVDGTDYVVKAAGILGWLAADLGDAGARGFLPSRVVHKVAMPLQSRATTTAFVQDVQTDAVDHSELVRSFNYQTVCWLPFLWRMPTGDFNEFLKSCEGIATHPRRFRQRYYDVSELRREFWEECRPFFEDKWSWEGRSQTVVSALGRQLQQTPGVGDSLYDKCLGYSLCLLCDIVYEATQGRGNREVLYPDWGIIYAAERILRDYMSAVE